MAEREHSHAHGQEHVHQHTHQHGHDHGHEHHHHHGHHHDHDHDHDHEHEHGEQHVTVEDAGPARKRLTIQVPQARIAKALDDKYSELKNDAVLPGFRRGRAPLRLLDKRFGTSVRDDVRGQI